MPEDWEHGGFGLYIHWPFCLAKCPYCDFNSHVAAKIDQKAWAAAYIAEIERVGAETKDKVLRSVFFGGGTPSLMDAETVKTILDAVRATWRQTNDIEITLEANPTSVDAQRFKGYAEAGVNRLSMGIQALNDHDLRRLGRMHTAEEAIQAFHIAREHFSRVSFDLIYARQDQTASDWEAELSLALDYAVDHLSLYQLTIEDGTAFGDRYKAGKLKGLPDEDLAADLWEVTQRVCNAQGFPGYEVSNHAKPGYESQHNQVYWRYGDYAGIGPGAHGRLTINGQKFATECPKAPGDWLRRVQAGTGEGPRVGLSADDQLTEMLLMGLRLSEGVLAARLPDESHAIWQSVGALEDEGFMERRQGRLRVTDAGRPLLNAVLRRLLAD